MSAHSKVSSVHLEYHSLRFAKMLFKRFPEWKPYSSYYIRDYSGKEKKYSSVYHLKVDIPPANSNVTELLSILVYPDQVIIQWIGGIHTHFDALVGGGAVGYMEAAIEYLEQIVTDQIVFGYYVQDGKPTGAYFSHGTEFERSSEWFSIQQGFIVMRSWNGTLDGELPGQDGLPASV